jgi:oligosaccharide repeat unit polymerase
MIKRALINPLFLYLSVWLTVFTLFALRLSQWLIELTLSFGMFALATAGSAVLGYLGAYSISLQPRGLRGKVPRLNGSTGGVNRVVKVLFAVMCIILPLEVAVSGGMPIFWILSGSSKTYVDYGIPTLHGFFNAIMLFEGTLCFWLITTNRATRLVKIIFALCILLPIAAITRQVLMSLLTQCFIIFVGARHSGRSVNLFRIAVVVLASLAIFSAIGVVRTNSEAFRQQVRYTPGYEWVPVGIMWPYMYFTTPINNFAFITSLELERTLGYSSFSSLTPSVVRELIWGPKKNTFLVVETFNVTSYATPLYLDFGWPGVMMFTLLLTLVATYAFRRLLRTSSLYYLLLLAVLNHVIILSFFFNFLLTWGVAFQLIILFFVKKYVIRVDSLVKPREQLRPFQDLKEVPPPIGGSITQRVIS